ncbi:MAG: hypothetical protein ACLF0P_11425 [Thermoanaerobaculia bacterium]
MRQRETDCTHAPLSGEPNEASGRTFPRSRAAEGPPGPPAPPPRPPGEPPNAFSPGFLDRVAAREPAPAVPEADFAGPWRVVLLDGDSDGARIRDGSPEWGCVPEGGRGPALVFDSPDLAYLAAAALEVAERPARFRVRDRPAPGPGEARRPGLGAGPAPDPDPHLEEPLDLLDLEVLHDGHPVGRAALAGDTLPLDLTRLADLRVRPRALAHLLLSVPEEVLRRAGVIVAEMAREGGPEPPGGGAVPEPPGGAGGAPAGIDASSEVLSPRPGRLRGRPLHAEGGKPGPEVTP